MIKRFTNLISKVMEVKEMKKILCLVAFCAVFLMMGSLALATTITPVNLVTPDGTVTIGQFDFAPGSALSVNGNPIGPGGSGNPINIKYQAFTSAFLDMSNLAVNLPNLNATYEFTVTANLWETVTFFGGGAIALFGLSPNPANLVTLWFDNSPDANVAAGTGFTGGIAALTAVPISLGGVYTLPFGDTNGNGVFDNQDVGTGSSDVVFSILTVDNTIFPTLQPGGLWVTHFTGTQNTPPEGVDTVAMFDGTVPNYFGMPASIGGPGTPFTTNDILLKADGNTHFTPIPEPSTIILLGSGMIGFGISYLRRRKK
jgi:hypothetical protein